MAGEIGDGRLLARFILPGGEYIKNNFPTNAAFATDDFIKRDGCSVEATEPGAAADAAAARHSFAMKKTYRYLLATAGDIRAIKDAEGRSVFVVVAAPVKGNPAHALVQFARPYDKGSIKKFRDRLRDVFGEVIAPR